MSSRDNILKAVKEAQPGLLPLPEHLAAIDAEGNKERFGEVLASIGGRSFTVQQEESIPEKIKELFPDARRMVSAISSDEQYFLPGYKDIKQQSLHDVDVVIMEAYLGVAENGSVWVTEEDTKMRVLPFICEHLVVLLQAAAIVSTMHHAYEKIGEADYGFGVFIAGPSKTADIEQSLVLGAHGPKSMTVIIVDN